MTKALAVAGGESRALALADDELIPVLQSSLYPGAKPESIKLVLGYCRAAGLDPMQKPVHIVPMLVSTGRKNERGYDDKEWRDVVMPGIGLYRVQASRTGELAGIDEPEFGPSLAAHGVEFPEWCRVTVYRMISGQRVAFTAREYWLENYATKGKDSLAPNAMWQRRPRGQLAKCAEAQALRKAFPELGSQPTADETIIDTGDVIDAATGAPVPPAGPTVARKPKAAPVPAADVEDATPAAPRASVSAEEKAAAGGAQPPAAAPAAAPAADGKMAGAGEIAYLNRKAESLGTTAAKIAEEIGLAGVVIEAGKLAKGDFDTLRAELMQRGA
jgi:phage recombination protein Bet